MEAVGLVILIGAALLLVSILTSLISFRIGAPLLLVFLAVGLAAGESGLGIEFENMPAAYLTGSVALVIILFDSGFNTSLASFRLAAWPAITLALFGTVLTAAILGSVAWLLFDMTWPEAFLIGAIVGSTDAAAVFFLLRVGGVQIRERVRSTLEIESGSNDPVAIFLTIGLVQFLADGSAGPLGLPAAFAIQILLGAAAGVAGGYLLAGTLNSLRLETALYPVLSVAGALLLFAVVNALGGSGFLAAYVAGLVVGNSRLHAMRGLRRFQDGLSWLAQIVMFLMLGLLASPSEFPGVLLPALLLAAALVLIARPIAVWLCLLPFRFPRNEVAFIAWVGLRGAVSILLAIVPILGGLPTGQTYFNVAFLIVVVSLLVQGWTIRPLARWLGLIVPPRIGPLDRTELDLPGTAEIELITYRIHPESPVARGQRLPRWARPALILRDGQLLNSHNVRQLQANDLVYLFAPAGKLRLLDKLFAGTREIGEDDSDFYGDFPLDPDTSVQALAEMYGLPLKLEIADLRLRELLRRELGGIAEVGDRLRLADVELIVREMQDGEIVSVGLALHPAPASRRYIPLFQTPGEIAEAARALARRTVAPARRLRATKSRTAR